MLRENIKKQEEVKQGWPSGQGMNPGKGAMLLSQSWSSLGMTGTQMDGLGLRPRQLSWKETVCTWGFLQRFIFLKWYSNSPLSRIVTDKEWGVSTTKMCNGKSKVTNARYDKAGGANGKGERDKQCRLNQKLNYPTYSKNWKKDCFKPGVDHSTICCTPL